MAKLARRRNPVDPPTLPLRVPDLLVQLARVPKQEIDEQERKSDRNFKRRTTHKAYAKAGRIVEQK